MVKLRVLYERAPAGHTPERRATVFAEQRDV